MICLAFKSAALAGGLFSEAIAKHTGGQFSHVEMWLSGPLNAAMCFSSREPFGTSFKVIDLSEQVNGKCLWTMLALKVATEQEKDAFWFCMGSKGRDYDSMGIIGIGLGTGVHDSSDRFCSEMVWDVGQNVFGWDPSIDRWMVAPDGHPVNGYGLHELIATRGY